MLGASLSFASGCATGAQTRHGIPAGQWQARLPTTRSPIDELAFGRGGSGTPAAADELVSLAAPVPDEVLQPMAAAKSVIAVKPSPRRPQLAAVTAPAQPAAPSAEPAPVVPEAAPAAPAPLLARNDADVQSRYAQREADSREQQKFRGGDAIVISAGALVVVLLIVILVLLLR